MFTDTTGLKKCQKWRVLCAGGMEPNICKSELSVFIGLNIFFVYVFTSLYNLCIPFLNWLYFFANSHDLFYAVIVVYVGMKLLIVNVTFGVGPSDLSDFKITTCSSHICSIST